LKGHHVVSTTITEHPVRSVKTGGQTPGAWQVSWLRGSLRAAAFPDRSSGI